MNAGENEATCNIPVILTGLYRQNFELEQHNLHTSENLVFHTLVMRNIMIEVEPKRKL